MVLRHKLSKIDTCHWWYIDHPDSWIYTYKIKCSDNTPIKSQWNWQKDCMQNKLMIDIPIKIKHIQTKNWLYPDYITIDIPKNHTRKWPKLDGHELSEGQPSRLDLKNGPNWVGMNWVKASRVDLTWEMTKTVYNPSSCLTWSADQEHI